MSLEHTSCHTVLTLMFRVWKPVVESFNDTAFEKKKTNQDKGFTLFKVGINGQFFSR